MWQSVIINAVEVFGRHERGLNDLENSVYGKSIVLISVISTAMHHWNLKIIWFAIVTYKHKGHFSPSTVSQTNIEDTLILSIPHISLILNI